MILRGIVVLLLVGSSFEAFGQMATAKPVSADLIVMEIDFNGQTSKIQTANGALVRWGNRNQNRHYGCVPVIQKDGSIAIQAYEIKKVTETQETMKSQQKIIVKADVPGYFDDSKTQVRFVEVKSAGKGEAAPAAKDDDCCVQCPNGQYTCACAVANDCGCCCDEGPCCRSWPPCPAG